MGVVLGVLLDLVCLVADFFSGNEHKTLFQFVRNR